MFRRNGLPRGVPWLVAVCLVVALAGWAFAESEEAGEDSNDVVVTMENFAFKPERYVVMPGEKIRFQVKNPSTGYHTFTIMRSSEDRDNPLVDADAPPGEDQVIELTMPEEETTLFLVCVPHEFLGMVGEIVVTPNPEARADRD